MSVCVTQNLLLLIVAKIQDPMGTFHTFLCLLLDNDSKQNRLPYFTCRFKLHSRVYLFEKLCK